MTYRRLRPLLLRGIAVIVLLLSGQDGHSLAEDNASNPQIDRYRQALVVDPDNLPLHYYLGVTLLLEDRNKEAITEFRRAYPAYADSIEMNYNLGLAYSRFGDTDSALLYFEQSEALGALDTPELYPLGNAYYNLGLASLEADALDEAAELFRRVLALDPSLVEIHRLLGDIYARQGATDKALEALSSYLSNYPEDVPAREYVYTLHFNQALKVLDSDQQKARDHLEKALTASPGSPLALYYLGYLDYRQDQPEDAVQKLKGAHEKAPPELQPSIHSILFNCALTLKERGQLPPAQTAVETLVAEGSADPKTLLLAGNIALDLKDFIRARDYYELVLSIDPGHRGALLNLVAADAGAVLQMVDRGRELYRGGEYAEALKQLEAALAINPSDPRGKAYAREARIEVEKQTAAYFAGATLALGEGHPQRAIDQARAGLLLAPNNAEGLALQERALKALATELEQTLAEGRRLMDSGELRLAISAFDRALSMDPHHPGARQGKTEAGQRLNAQALEANDRGQLALEEGKLLEARAAFTESLVLDPGLNESQAGLARVEVLETNVVNEEVQWGRRAVSAGNFAQAREHFTNALRLKDSPEIRRQLNIVEMEFVAKMEALVRAAKAKAAKEDFKGARRVYAQILAQNPRHAAASEGLRLLDRQTTAYVQEQLSAATKDLADGNVKEALGRYRRVLDIEPANGGALDGLNRGKGLLGEQLSQLTTAGRSALDAGLFQEAETTFTKVLAIDPYNREAQAAMTRLKKAVAADVPLGDPQQLYLEGIELYTRGLYQEAVAAWKQVLVLSPGHEKALLNIEKAHRKLRQIQEYQGG